MSELCLQHTALFVGDIKILPGVCLFLHLLSVWNFYELSCKPTQTFKDEFERCLTCCSLAESRHKVLTQERNAKEKLWGMRWRQWNWLQTWLQIFGRPRILANCNRTTRTKLNALSYEAPTSCYTQDSCGDCKGHNATWSNLAATQAETP